MTQSENENDHFDHDHFDQLHRITQQLRALLAPTFRWESHPTV